MAFETKIDIYELQTVFFIKIEEGIENICDFINQLNKNQKIYKVGDKFEFKNEYGIYFEFYIAGIFGIRFGAFSENKKVDMWDILFDMHRIEIMELFIEIIESFDLDWEKDNDKYTWFERNPKLIASNWLESAKIFVERNKGD
ncbi:MAG: hypothetical protein ISP01_05340 [Methanobrevibacter arboriphilus]|uniref:Uncharacterized protein n=1 Tax=Methanobrevibacter arboriphilus TaxID=39441 RepID=A0A843ACU7_METAZ|nr:hypothetical protein [Methanobrevibacter arboriphilus]MBF4468812.1 hypothetical protein [Methanobrevibacter arboriphilus]